MSPPATSPAHRLKPGTPLTLAQVADGAEGLVLADLARAIAAAPDAPAISLCIICRDGQRMAQLARSLAFFGPDLTLMEFPAWDCLPYDRVSPNAAVVAQRMTALSRLARVKGRDRPSVLLTGVNAALQRVPARDFVAAHALSLAPGNVIGMHGIVDWLELNGFLRASTVREPGDYAVRGGILDLFPPGMDMPVRLDFFGDAIETMRSFDPQTQRSEGDLRRARPGAGGGIPAHHRDNPPFPHRLCRRIRRRRARRPPLRGGERRPPLSRHGALAAAVPQQTGNAVRLPAGYGAGAGAFGRGRRARALHADCRLLRGAAAGPDRGREPHLQAAAAGAALSRRRRMARAAGHGAAGKTDALRGAGRCRRHRYRRAAGTQFRRRARRARRQCVRSAGPARAGAAIGRQTRRRGAVERGRARAHEPCARRSQTAQSHARGVLAAGAGPAQI